MADLNTWGDKEHEQQEISLELPVSEALGLSAALPRLLDALSAQAARTPEDRDEQRAARACLLSLVERLRVSLRPYDVPAPADVQDQVPH